YGEEGKVPQPQRPQRDSGDDVHEDEHGERQLPIAWPLPAQAKHDVPHLRGNRHGRRDEHPKEIAAEVWKGDEPEKLFDRKEHAESNGRCGGDARSSSTAGGPRVPDILPRLIRLREERDALLPRYGRRHSRRAPESRKHERDANTTVSAYPGGGTSRHHYWTSGRVVRCALEHAEDST